MEEIHYIAQIGNMYVNAYYSAIGDISLKQDKKWAMPLKKSDAIEVQKQTGAKIIEVKVTMTEVEVEEVVND